MTRNDLAEPILPLDLVHDLVARHGAARVLRAWLATLGRGRRPPPDAAPLSDHIRRDIGLPPLGGGRPDPRWY